MTEEMRQDDKNKALFANLVMMLSSSAMQQLGKLVDPITNETEVHLEGAQISIDMLEMLKAKTSGNLGDDEGRMLTDLLASLQMNYVQVARSAPPKADETPTDAAPGAPADGAAPESSAEEDAAPPTAADAATEAKESRDPKFHKSYGDS